MVECKLTKMYIGKMYMIRFNRYMVECKYRRNAYHRYWNSSFNRYMVECKFEIYGVPSKNYSVLIDTWWNVNFNTKWDRGERK